MIKLASLRDRPPSTHVPVCGAYKGSKVRCTASHDRLPRAQPNACDDYQPGTSFEPFDKFPAAHKKDPTNWATDGTGSDFSP